MRRRFFWMNGLGFGLGVGLLGRGEWWAVAPMIGLAIVLVLELLDVPPEPTEPKGTLT